MRTKGAIGKISKDEKEFIEQLLRKSQEQFEEEFMRLANSDVKTDKDNFMLLRNALQKLVVPRPTEVKIKHDDEDFTNLLQLFNDNEKGDD